MKGKRGMRNLTKILTGVATVAAAFAIAVPAASADPINGSGKAVVPAEYDIVGVGSNSIQFVMDQLAFNYDTNSSNIKEHGSGHPDIYSWDATTPGTDTSLDNIQTKSGCTAIPRASVNGSSGGITELQESVRTKDKDYYCIDFARSPAPRRAATRRPTCSCRLPATR